MTQKSTPYDGIRPVDIDAGPYTSKNILNERRHNNYGGVTGCIVGGGLDVQITNISNLTKTLLITVSNLHAMVDGTTVYADAPVELQATWIDIPLNSGIITFQIGVLVNREYTHIVHSGVAPRTARLICEVYADEYGMYAPDYDKRTTSELFIMPIYTLFYTMDAGNNIQEDTLIRYVTKRGVHWTLLNVFRDSKVRGNWVAPFTIANWEVITMRGAIAQGIPRIILDMRPLVSIETYADGIDTESSIHTYPSGDKVIYLSLTNRTISEYEVVYFTIQITRQGMISGTSQIVNTGVLDSFVQVFSGIVDFGSDKATIHDFVESLFNTTAAEMTLEVT